MKLINEHRNSFKEDTSAFFKEWVYTTGEQFPFSNIGKLQESLIQRWGIWGVAYLGFRTAGPALIFGGEWMSEKISVEVMIIVENLELKSINFKWK
jgi:hypothetical protein